MKKTLTISFDSSNYVISDGTNKVVILGSDLILKGQDLFDKFYVGFRNDESFEMDVKIDSSVVDSKDKHIAEEIKGILDSINKKLSEKVKAKIEKQEKEEDKALLNEEISNKMFSDDEIIEEGSSSFEEEIIEEEVDSGASDNDLPF